MRTLELFIYIFIVVFILYPPQNTINITDPVLAFFRTLNVHNRSCQMDYCHS